MATYPVSRFDIGDGNTYEFHGSGVDTQARADIADMKKALPKFLNTSDILLDYTNSGGSLNYTATKDCFISLWATSAGGETTIYLNNVVIGKSSLTFITTNIYVLAMSLYLKKGDTIRTDGVGVRCIILGLRE